MIMRNKSWVLVLTAGSNVVWFLLHLIGMTWAAGSVYAFTYLAYAFYTMDWSSQSQPPYIEFMHRALFTTLSLVACAGGVSSIFLLLENLYKHSEPFCASRAGRYLARFPGLVVFKRIHDKYWLPTPPSHRRERFFYLKRVLIRQVIKLPLNLLFLFGLAVTLLICAWLCAHWIALLIMAMDSLWLLGWLLVSIVLVPSMGLYSYLMLLALCTGFAQFLVDVKRDFSVDGVDNNVPV
ncbi:hypothetical protein M413DRAFT_167573 [Hebeloma cylindrosporum]|uniref:Uncharacterized protein n=1 Tax=Hebeloma cylindrosporum TaxID=76867 RepID=A0A0C2YI85_HEBCY|nr:hypothetical protein M413DRAFT_167573 [Hebeloma cylindrosporum h7]